MSWILMIIILESARLYAIKGSSLSEGIYCTKVSMPWKDAMELCQRQNGSVNVDIKELQEQGILSPNTMIWTSMYTRRRWKTSSYSKLFCAFTYIHVDGVQVWSKDIYYTECDTNLQYLCNDQNGTVLNIFTGSFQEAFRCFDASVTIYDYINKTGENVSGYFWIHLPVSYQSKNDLQDTSDESRADFNIDCFDVNVNNRENRWIESVETPFVDNNDNNSDVTFINELNNTLHTTTVSSAELTLISRQPRTSGTSDSTMNILKSILIAVCVTSRVAVS
ncbi:hypothetical protein ACF0H5_009797 [Mactra antiquata]